MIVPDFVDSGSGPLVVLIHSSVAGARQWRRLMEDLSGEFQCRAVNLFGYGATPPWGVPRSQTLHDQAQLVAAALPGDEDPLAIVGHSLGGSVAMKLAAGLGDRVHRLILLEPNPFSLLEQSGRTEAFAEVMQLRDVVKTCGARGDWRLAAQPFADYWNGPGSWEAMPEQRRGAFAEALKPNFHEWDAVLGERTTASEWAALLPSTTLLVSDPHTLRPIREIEELLRNASPEWRHASIASGGHMAPLTRPDLVNPLIAAFLAE